MPRESMRQPSTLQENVSRAVTTTLAIDNVVLYTLCGYVGSKADIFPFPTGRQDPLSLVRQLKMCLE